MLVVAVVERGRQVVAPGARQPSAAAPGAFGQSSIEIPEGGRIVGMTAEGERLVLRLSLADGGERLLIIDLGSGEAIGTITLGPAR